jgi:hypothetical protein
MPSKQRLKQTADGISLMAFFTFFWALLAEIALQRRDHYMLGVFFGVIVVLLIIYYIKFNSAEKKLPMPPLPPLPPAGNDTPKKTQDKRLILFIGLEAAAILVIKNVLANTGLDDYFVPCFALIVFPPGKTF